MAKAVAFNTECAPLHWNTARRSPSSFVFQTVGTSQAAVPSTNRSRARPTGGRRHWSCMLRRIEREAEGRHLAPKSRVRSLPRCSDRNFRLALPQVRGVVTWADVNLHARMQFPKIRNDVGASSAAKASMQLMRMRPLRRWSCPRTFNSRRLTSASTTSACSMAARPASVMTYPESKRSRSALLCVLRSR